MSRDKAIYKCPVCGFLTHFPKALEAHQRHRRHFPAPETPVVEEVVVPVEEPEVVEEVTETAEEEAVIVEKKARKPRKKAEKESEE